MKITQNQFYELWKIKVAVYALKTSKGIWESCFLQIFILLVPLSVSGFKKQAVITYFVSYSLFLVSTLAILYKTKSIKLRRFHTKHAYPLTTLLYNIYDISFLGLCCTSSWATAVYIFEEKLSIPITGFSWFLFFTIVIIAILFSPRLINYMSLNKPDRLDKYLPFAPALSGAIPGLGLLIATILSRTKQLDAGYYLLLFLSIISSSLLLPIIVLNIYQIIFLGLNRWPEIKRDGNKFIIVQEINGQIE